MTDPIAQLNAALEGRYDVERKLGEGGMATVYLATDLRHERRVALKVLKPELAAVVGAERFLAEIKTTANLQHPHILPLFDSGEAASFLFYVMPYVEGETLRDRIERERQLPVDEAVRIATVVANALQHAHDRGVIHRDIKPANILMQDGEPVVADFGIALAVGAAGGSRLTETGLSVGTPFYMSPEQATGDQQIGPRSDTYALAAVLYEMLTGEPPYTGTTAQAVLGRILQGAPVSATELRQSVSRNVDAAVRRALEKLPADRFTRASDFAAALGDPGFRHGVADGTAGRAAGGGSGFWKPLSLGLAALSAGLLLWTGWMALGGGMDREVRRQRVVLWESLQSPMGGPINVGNFTAIAPDGSAIVFSDMDANGNLILFRKLRDEAFASPIAGTEGGASPAYSPDGEWLAYATSENELRKVRSAGGGSVTLTDGMPGSYAPPFWGEDGYIYYVDSGFDISRIHENGGAPEPVVEVGSRLGLLASSVWVLPGSRGLLISGCTGNCNASDILVYDMESDEMAVLFEDAYGAAYLPSGHVVYVSLAGGAYAARMDLATLSVSGGSVPVLEEVAPFGLTFNREGTAIYGVELSGAVNELVWVTRQGRATPIDPDWTGLFNYPALSPDGRRLAVSLVVAGEEQIWIKQLDRGPEEKLTFEGSGSFRPTWTPDGQTITYVVGGDDLSRDLYSRRADGSSAEEILLDLPVVGVWESQYSSDGQWMLYRIDLNAQGDIFALSLETGDTLSLVESEYNERQLALSPDNRWLAYISDRSGRFEVYVRPFPNTGDGRWVVTSDGGSEPLWSSDGTELFYREGGMLKSLEVLPGEGFVAGAVTELFPDRSYTSAFNRRQYDLSSDDQRFLMIRSIEGGSLDLVYVENWFAELEERLGS
jgi:serine/threonine-protein kinase